MKLVKLAIYTWYQISISHLHTSAMGWIYNSTWMPFILPTGVFVKFQWQCSQQHAHVPSAPQEVKQTNSRQPFCVAPARRESTAFIIPTTQSSNLRPLRKTEPWPSARVLTWMRRLKQQQWFHHDGALTSPALEEIRTTQHIFPLLFGTWGWAGGDPCR